MPSAMGLGGLLPEVRWRVSGMIEEARRRGITVRVTSTRRSMAEQARLFRAWEARGRTGLPAARPGTSTHNFGLAVDLVASDTAIMAAIAECWGMRWAGARDPVHFDPIGFEAWDRYVRTGVLTVPPLSCRLSPV